MARILKLTALTLTISAAAMASGCLGNRGPDVLAAQAPDDFRVVARAPLIFPPEFALRPPSPGEPRPQELNPEAAARTALVGTRLSSAVSEGERMLITRAGGMEADPLIREVIDDEQGDLAHKRQNFADLVMFWRPGQPNTPAADTTDATALDPAAEAARIRALTGDAAVVIQREPAAEERRGFKLPGL